MSDNKDLADQAFQVIGNRQVWENKQRLYYQMRHDGLRRLNKPFPTAADLHMPLVDNTINGLKPFWIAHIFGGQRLTDFVCMREQLKETTEAAADYFDFELRMRTDFRYKMETVVDTMLLRGRGILKVTCDPFEDYEIKFKAIDPMFMIVPMSGDDFQDADWFVEVQTLTVPKYQRNRNYNQDPSVIKAIRGNNNMNWNAILVDKEIREGITHSAREDTIILWHHWVKSDKNWLVHTYSPQAPDKKIRNDYYCPYKVDGKPSLPYHSFTMEIKDEGWYSPRGVAELNAAFEVYATKLWNEKSDAMTFGNRPLFTADSDIPNISNMRFNPGEFVPGNIKAVQMQPPAYSFSEEINFSREMAEQRARTPDFGIQEGNAGKNSYRTATENNRIAGLQSVGADYNGDVLREVRFAEALPALGG